MIFAEINTELPQPDVDGVSYLAFDRKHSLGPGRKKTNKPNPNRIIIIIIIIMIVIRRAGTNNGQSHTQACMGAITHSYIHTQHVDGSVKSPGDTARRPSMCTHLLAYHLFPLRDKKDRVLPSANSTTAAVMAAI